VQAQGSCEGNPKLPWVESKTKSPLVMAPLRNMVDDGAARESEVIYDFNLISTLNILQLFHEVTTIIIAAPIAKRVHSRSVA
jgi:hypothetical protein